MTASSRNNILSLAQRIHYNDMTGYRRRCVLHGQWNTARLVVNGDHVEHWLNGVKLLEYELGSADWKDRVRKSKFNAMPLYGTAKQGHIGLQDHGDRVAFRNIRIRVLP